MLTKARMLRFRFLSSCPSRSCTGIVSYHALAPSAVPTFPKCYALHGLVNSTRTSVLITRFESMQSVSLVRGITVYREHILGRRMERKTSRCMFTSNSDATQPYSSRDQAAGRNDTPGEGLSQLGMQKNLRESYMQAAPLQYSASVSLPQLFPQRLQIAQMSPADQAFVLLGFIAFMTSFALFALILTAIPTLSAMRRAAISMEKLADIAREELPGTMAAIRLSGMEISDLTLELNDLSQEISDGIRSSARAVQAAEVGIRRVGALAASQTLAMIQERASLPVEVVRPAVVSAAATTLHAVARAQKLVINLATHPRISGWLRQKPSGGKDQSSVCNIGEQAMDQTETFLQPDLAHLPPASSGHDHNKQQVSSGK